MIPITGREQIAECRWKVFLMRKGKWHFEDYPYYYTDEEMVKRKDELEKMQGDGRIVGYEIHHLDEPYIRKQIPIYFS